MNNKCLCGAKSRTNFPYGRNGGRRVIVVKAHCKDCRYFKEVDNNV